MTDSPTIIRDQIPLRGLLTLDGRRIRVGVYVEYPEGGAAWPLGEPSENDIEDAVRTAVELATFSAEGGRPAPIVIMFGGYNANRLLCDCEDAEVFTMPEGSFLVATVVCEPSQPAEGEATGPDDVDWIDAVIIRPVGERPAQ